MDRSGKFVLRAAPRLHKRLSQAAHIQNLSLNRLCINLLENGLSQKNTTDPLPPFQAPLKPVTQRLEELFAENLLGVIAFGSRVSGGATENSDLDLLIVLADAVPISRSLYLKWDDQVPEPLPFEISPHFVHLPVSPLDSSGLWFEVGMAYHVVWERGSSISGWLAKIKDLIAEDAVRRYSLSGHPYWIKMSK